MRIEHLNKSWRVNGCAVRYRWEGFAARPAAQMKAEFTIPEGDGVLVLSSAECGDKAGPSNVVDIDCVGTLCASALWTGRDPFVVFAAVLQDGEYIVVHTQGVRRNHVSAYKNVGGQIREWFCTHQQWVDELFEKMKAFDENATRQIDLSCEGESR